MPSSAVRTFTDCDEYFAGNPNLQIEGFVARRGGLRTEATRIDRHWLWIHRFHEDLLRIMKVMPSGHVNIRARVHAPTRGVAVAGEITRKEGRDDRYG